MATTAKSRSVADLIAEWRGCGCTDSDIILWAERERLCTPRESLASNIACATLAFYGVA